MTPTPLTPAERRALVKAQQSGRNRDTILAHINPEEAQLLKQRGGSGTINPNTGLVEFDDTPDSGYDSGFGADAAAGASPAVGGVGGNYGGYGGGGYDAGYTGGVQDTTSSYTGYGNPGESEANITTETGISADMQAAMDRADEANAADRGAMFNPDLSYSDLNAMKGLGLGAMDVVEGQTVDQALNSQAFSNYADKNIGMLTGLVAGPISGMLASTVSSLAQGKSISDVLGAMAGTTLASAVSQATGLPISTQTFSDLAVGDFGKAAMGTALGQVARDTGVSVPALTSAMQGNFGPAVANTATASVLGALTSALGRDQNFVSAATQLSGLDAAAASAVSAALGSQARGQGASAPAAPVSLTAPTIGTPSAVADAGSFTPTSVNSFASAAPAVPMFTTPPSVTRAAPPTNATFDERAMLNLEAAFTPTYFSQLAATKPAQTTKMAEGGYLDSLLAENISVDDLIRLLS